MSKVRSWALTIAVIGVSLGAGVATWLVVGPVAEVSERLPHISAYSDNHSVRVGPYRYCNVVDFTDCHNLQTQGELAVSSRNPVQLSVPPTIGQAPWRLLKVYEGQDNSTVTVYRPGTRLAATIATVDPLRGQLTGIAVQLLTLVVDDTGQFYDVPHAEWSVRMVWHTAKPTAQPKGM